MHYTYIQKIVAEFLGTMFLLMAIVGSGIMAEALSDGNTGLALLAHAIAVGAILYVLITLLSPISGAHFNPAVTLVFAFRDDLMIGLAFLYIIAQICGGIAGTWLTHVMFEIDILQVSGKARSGYGQFFGEVVATFGLVFTILAALKSRPSAVAPAVGLFITSAIWFTSSTSLANPAVTIARSLSDSFTGIRPDDVPLFVLAQILGSLMALMLGIWLIKERQSQSGTSDEIS